MMLLPGRTSLPGSTSHRIIMTPEERKEAKRIRNSNYCKTEKYRAARREYNSRPEVKERRKLKGLTPEQKEARRIAAKAKHQARKNDPEYKAKRKAYMDEYRAKNYGHIKEYHEDYKAKNADKIKEYESSPERLAAKKASKSTPEYKANDVLRAKRYAAKKPWVPKFTSWKGYGIIFKDKEEQWSYWLKVNDPKTQCEGCLITNEDHINKTGKSLCLDHDHISGKPRAVLCNNCNDLIGRIEAIQPEIRVEAIERINKILLKE